MTDTERLDWLADYNPRMQDVYYRIENEGCSLRDAIDWMAERHAKEAEEYERQKRQEGEERS